MSAGPPIDLIIVGAGGHGSEVYSYLEDVQTMNTRVTFLGFVVDREYVEAAQAIGPVLGDFSDLAERMRRGPDTVIHYITAIGDNAARQELVIRLETLALGNLRPWTLRHPDAVVGRGVQIGPGSCLAPGVIVTTRVRIGAHSILNVNASVSHDCVIGEFSNINPGAVIAGTVRIGRHAFVGARATVIQRISLGEGSIVGAGAVVIRDVPPHATVVGVPARIIKLAGVPVAEQA